MKIFTANPCFSNEKFNSSSSLSAVKKAAEAAPFYTDALKALDAQGRVQLRIKRSGTAFGAGLIRNDAEIQRQNRHPEFISGSEPDEILKQVKSLPLTCSFGGNSDLSFIEMTDEKFNEAQREFDRHLKLLPEKIQSEAMFWHLNKANINLALKIINEEELRSSDIVMPKAGLILHYISKPEQAAAADKILSDEKFTSSRIFMEAAAPYIVSYSDKPFAGEIAARFLSDEKLYKNSSLLPFVYSIFKECGSDIKSNTVNKILDNEDLTSNEIFMRHIENVLSPVKTPHQAHIAEKITGSSDFYASEEFMKNYASEIIRISSEEAGAAAADKILSDKNIYTDSLVMPKMTALAAFASDSSKADVIDIILSDKKIYKSEPVLENAEHIIRAVNSKEQAQLARQIFSNEKLYTNQTLLKEASYFVSAVKTAPQYAAAGFLLSLDNFADNEQLINNAYQIISAADSKENSDKIIELLSSGCFAPVQVPVIIKNPELKASVLKLNASAGIEKAGRLSSYETCFAADNTGLCGKNSILELSGKDRKKLIRLLQQSDNSIMNFSDNMKELFPLLPQNQEEISSLISALAAAAAPKIQPLKEQQLDLFNNTLTSLEKTLAAMSDEEFNGLEINLKYSRADFIKNVFDKIKHLSYDEQQEVFDFFNFELTENPNAVYKAPDGKNYSLTGYPAVNKIPLVLSPDAKEAAEQLKADITDFTSGNKIFCSNKELEKELNSLISVMPELIPSAECMQAGMNGAAGAHIYTVFKHSLKVFQSIVKDTEYQKLNVSDKNIMKLAALFHDIAKKEGSIDEIHPYTSSSDAYNIIQKLNLSRNEQIKLYTLIKNHEWLKEANTDSLGGGKLLAIAYDHRNDNIFDMALIFTHADLKGVNPYFNDIFGAAADTLGGRIKLNIKELQKSQPILPAAPIPKADRIDKAVTEVHKDGSTNIKGVYKDKNGLIILKYNELENKDLEALGFPKGSAVKGIKIKTGAGENIDTGNIKFFIHGLDFPNQAANFDTFSSITSDALLSASYAELPETKYKFFKPQGLILNCSYQYIHGGGKTNGGSGLKKNIEGFKNNYILNPENKSERTFISDLIKEKLNLSDEEYVKFVQENENKSFSEIQPEELRNSLIKALAELNSNISTGLRNYNEIFISNPMPPMAVFAYSLDDNVPVNNPLDFLEINNITEAEKKILEETQQPVRSIKERTGFIKEYAAAHNIPLVIFGD